MRIKRFEAKNMTTALRMIKAELGPDAVILSARSLRKGKGLLGSMKYMGVEVTAAIDTRQTHLPNGSTLGSQAASAKLSKSQSLEDSRPVRQDSGPPSAYTAQGWMLPNQRSDDKNINSSHQRVLSVFYQQLLAQGVDRGITSELIEEIKRIPDFQNLATNGDLKAQLGSILEEMGVWADKNAFATDKPKILALVGSTGAGKTTTIAKLAAIQANRRRKQVALISIDNYGIAANEQLKSYARIIGVPLETAVTPVELRPLLKKFKGQDFVFIDTPGLNPSDPDQIAELKSYFAKLPELQKHLVVSVATKEKDLIEIAEAFKKIGVQRLLFTKLDESGTYGNMLNMLIRTNIPLSFMSCGRKVPDDIEAGSIPKLVDLIFSINALKRRSATGSSDLKAQKSAAFQESSPIRWQFVANKNSDVFHRMDCKWSDRIKPENMIKFAGIQEAKAQRFLPCRSCNPDRPRGDAAVETRTGPRTFSSYI